MASLFGIPDSSRIHDWWAGRCYSLRRRGAIFPQYLCCILPLLDSQLVLSRLVEDLQTIIAIPRFVELVLASTECLAIKHPEMPCAVFMLQLLAHLLRRLGIGLRDRYQSEFGSVRLAVLPCMFVFVHVSLSVIVLLLLSVL